MVGICFYFENNDVDVWSGRRIDLDAWNYTMKACGDIDEVIIINKTSLKVEGPDASIPTTEVSEFPNLSGSIAYVCCPWDTADTMTSLWEFDHNVDWYAFGPATGWQQQLLSGVYVPVASNLSLHSTHIASTVLLHRYHVVGGG